MIKQLITLLGLLICSSLLHAQDTGGYMLDSVFTLPEANINDRFLNDTERYRYNQMKYYVKSILPYVNAATSLFREVDQKLNEPGLRRKERKAYVRTREDEMRTQFEDKMRKLNVTQGALLVKLIARQTELNIYKMLQEFKNPVTAVKWQAWARVNGMNLDRKYAPDEERTLELIMEELGYPLPAGYRDALYLIEAKS